MTMKHEYFLLTLFLILSASLSAQRAERIPAEEVPSQMDDSKIELKANPIALILGGFQAEAEVKVSNNFGMGVNLVTGQGAFMLAGRTKYYFKPKRGCDRFYIGAQAGVYDYGFSNIEIGPGIGFDMGYKFVSKDSVIIDLSFGVVRASDVVWAIGSLGVGYRF